MRLLSGEAFLFYFPVECTQDHSARDLGLLILEECDGSK